MWPVHIYWMGWTKRGSHPSPHKAANPFCALYQYLAFSCADIVEGHGTLTGSNGNAMAAVTVTNHIEPVQNRQKCPSFAETIEYLQDRRLRLYRLKHTLTCKWQGNILEDLFSSQENLRYSTWWCPWPKGGQEETKDKVRGPFNAEGSSSSFRMWVSSTPTSTNRSTTSPGIFSIRMSMTRRISVFALARVVVWMFCCDWELAWAALYRWTWGSEHRSNEITF